MTAQSRHKLETDGTVVLGNGEVLRASEKLGEGSFGAVWRMEGHGNGSLALKETISDSEASYQQTVSEAKLLQTLTTTQGLNVGGVPRYVGHEGVRVGEQRWRMRLLMTVVAGEPLDQWMSRKSRAGDFHVAMIETRELLSQMAETMNVVEKFCMHRDISSHNIMVDDTTSSGGRAKYSLIDFGLAVDRRTWLTRWREFNLAGDCKYWPPSAWILFTHGPGGMRMGSAEGKQFIECLDVFGLGITCLEFLMNRAPSDCPVLTELRRVWEDYWGTTGECWGQFYACFKGQGDWDQLRSSLSTRNITMVILTKLINLIEEIDRLAKRQAEDPLMASLLSTLRMMIAPPFNSTVDFKAVVHNLENFRNVARYGAANSNARVLFNHVRTASSSCPNGQPFLGPVVADFRSPLLAQRRIQTPGGFLVQN